MIKIDLPWPQASAVEITVVDSFRSCHHTATGCKFLGAYSMVKYSVNINNSLLRCIIWY